MVGYECLSLVGQVSFSFILLLFSFVHLLQPTPKQIRLEAWLPCSTNVITASITCSFDRHTPSMNLNIPGMSIRENRLNQKFSQLQVSAFHKDIGHTSRPSMRGHGDMDILPVPSVGSRVSVYVCEALGVSSQWERWVLTTPALDPFANSRYHLDYIPPSLSLTMHP